MLLLLLCFNYILSFFSCDYFWVQLRNIGIPSECLDYNAPDQNPTGAHVSLFGCHGQGGNQVIKMFILINLGKIAVTNTWCILM